LDDARDRGAPADVSDAVFDHHATTLEPALAKIADAALALTAEIAHGRLARDAEGVIATLTDAIRETGAAARAAIDELAIEISRALAAGEGERALEVARHLQRALRRGRGDSTSRASAFTALARIVAWSRPKRSAELSLLRADLLELARERVEAGASKPAPQDALVSLMRKPESAPSSPMICAESRARSVSPTMMCAPPPRTRSLHSVPQRPASSSRPPRGDAGVRAIAPLHCSRICP
jgi:hypothetical protein